MRVSELQPRLRTHSVRRRAARLHNLNSEYIIYNCSRRGPVGRMSHQNELCAADALVTVHVQSQSRSSIRALSTFPSAFSRAKSTLSLEKPMSTICLTASESSDGTVGTDDADGAAGGGGKSAEVEA